MTVGVAAAAVEPDSVAATKTISAAGRCAEPVAADHRDQLPITPEVAAAAVLVEAAEAEEVRIERSVGTVARATLRVHINI